jgi:hypothetical protein
MLDKKGSCHIHCEERIEYLGVWIDSSLSSEVEIAARITSASKAFPRAFGALHQTLLSKHVAPKVKGKLFRTVVFLEYSLTYSSECWSLTSDVGAEAQAATF